VHLSLFGFLLTADMPTAIRAIRGDITYESSLRLAADNKLHSVAFPAISTGAYAYPLKLATEVAVAAVRGFLAGYTDFEEIVFCSGRLMMRTHPEFRSDAFPRESSEEEAG
jgi:Macro domain